MAIISFDKGNTKNKQPIDLIQETGKFLHKCKDKCKGKCYFNASNNNECITPSFGKRINVKIIPIAQYKNNLNVQKNTSTGAKMRKQELGVIGLLQVLVT